jgi:prevent-host-death family protein
MRKTSLVHAKAHLSELVDLAEHKGHRVLILRHGKPAAALVPVDVAMADLLPKPQGRLTDEELADFWSGFGGGDTARSAVSAMIENRSRLDGR